MIARRREWVAAAAALVAAAVACKSSEPSSAPASGTAEKAIEFIEVVRGGALPAEPLPMIVVIHGLGDRPENLGRIFEGFPGKARFILLRATEKYGDGFSWFSVGWKDGSVVARAEDVSRTAGRIAARIAELARDRPTAGKPIVTGFSQGGIIAFYLAIYHAEQFERSLPISGWLPPELIPNEELAKKAAPILAFHGDADRLVPYEPTRQLIEVLKARGARARLVTIPGVKHSITPEMRDEIFEELGSPAAE